LAGWSSRSPSGCDGTDYSHAEPRNRIKEDTVMTIIAAGAAGWLILLLMCAYAKARERRN
jgi:hypothetical protein